MAVDVTPKRWYLKGFLSIIESPGALAGLLLLSFTLESVLVWYRGVYSPDSALYIAAAAHFEAGAWAKGFAIYPLPTLSLLLALLHRLLGSWGAAAFLCSVIPAVLTLVPIYQVTCDLFDRRAAFWATAAFALSPYMNKFGAELIRDPLSLCCFSWAMFFAVRFLLTERIRWLLGCIALFWASLLFRIDGVFFYFVLLLVLAVLAYTQPQKRDLFMKGAALWGAFPVFALVLLALLLPEKWLAVTQGDFISSRLNDLLSLRFLDHYHALYTGLQELGENNTGWADGLFPEMTSHYLLILYGLLLIEYFLRILYVPYGIPLLIGIRSRWTRGRALVVVTAAAFFTVSYLYLLQEGWIAKRYLSLLVILAAPWVGRGMTRILDLLATTSMKRALATVVALGFFIVPAWSTVTLGLETAGSSIREAGAWIATQKQWRNATIYTTDNRLLLYAGRYTEIPSWRVHGKLNARLRPLMGSRKAVLAIVETEDCSFDETYAHLADFTRIRYFKDRVHRVMVLCRKTDTAQAR
jgi:hypothetical protein